MNCGLCGDFDEIINKNGERIYSVYIHVSPNYKIYVGMTGREDINDRWQNGNGYANNRYFYNAISKYGWDNFKHEILFDNLTFEEANLTEMFYISYYDTYNNPKKGYNQTRGGQGCKGRVVTEEQKIHLMHMSKSKRPVINVTTNEKFDSIGDAGKKYGKSDKISNCCKGVSKTSYGCDWWFIDEYENGLEKGSLKYNKISEATDEKVICVTTGEIFNNAKSASNKYNVNKFNIIRCCKGKSITCGKLDNTRLMWMFKNEYDKYEKEGTLNQELLKRQHSNGKHGNTRVICLNTDHIFNNVYEASVYYNLNFENIKKCCENKQNYTLTKDGCRLYWIYENENDEDVILYKRELIKIERIKNSNVICLNTREEFENIDHASKSYNINKNYLYNCCMGKSKYVKINKKDKLIFMFKYNYLKLNDNEISNLISKICERKNEVILKENKDMRVICTTTMEIFDNAKQASEKYNVHSTNINKCCVYMGDKSKPKKVNKHAGQLEDGTKLSWQYYKDYLVNGLKEPEKSRQGRNSAKKIICLDTNKIYDSTVQASKDTGIKVCTLNACLRKRLKTAKGTKWKYLDEK